MQPVWFTLRTHAENSVRLCPKACSTHAFSLQTGSGSAADAFALIGKIVELLQKVLPRRKVADRARKSLPVQGSILYHDTAEGFSSRQRKTPGGGCP